MNKKAIRAVAIFWLVVITMIGIGMYNAKWLGYIAIGIVAVFLIWVFSMMIYTINLDE